MPAKVAILIKRPVLQYGRMFLVEIDYVAQEM